MCRQVSQFITHLLGNISQEQSSLCTVTLNKYIFQPQVLTDLQINSLMAFYICDQSEYWLASQCFSSFSEGKNQDLMQATASVQLHLVTKPQRKTKTPASVCIATTLAKSSTIKSSEQEWEWTTVIQSFLNKVPYACLSFSMQSTYLFPESNRGLQCLAQGYVGDRTLQLGLKPPTCH